MSDISILWAQPKERLAAIMIGLMVAAGITGAYWALKASDNPPTAVLNSRILNPTVEQGGILRLYVEITSRANRGCEGFVTREFFRPTEVNGKEVPDIWRISAPVPIVTDNTNAYIVNIPLVLGTTELPVGDWSFQGETSYFCGAFFGGTKRYRTTFKDIKIVPKGSL